MTAHPCTHCNQPIIDTGILCHECTNQLGTNLRNIATDWIQLQITLTRQDRIGDPATATAEQPLPFNYQASEIAYAARNTLTSWAKHVEGKRGKPMPTMPKRDLAPQAAQYLTQHTDWIRHQDEAPQIADEIDDVAKRIRRCIDRPSPSVFCGTCVVCGDYLYANAHAATTSCRKGCEGEYDVAEQRAWLLEQAENQIAHASLIARSLVAFGEAVNYSTIRTWAERGRIVRRGRDSAGRPLYAVRDVLEIVRSDAYKTRRRKAS